MELGAGDRIRTGDIDLGGVAFFRLNYSRTVGKATLIRPCSMTIRTYDIAFRGLRENYGACAMDDSGDHEFLLQRIAMIELHDAWQKAAAAVSAGNVSHLIQHLQIGSPTSSLACDVR